jgi:hypothetical protein
VRLRLASSSLSPRRVGTMHWRAHACRMATTIPPYPAHLLTTNVRTKIPSASPPRQPLPLLPSLRFAPRERTLTLLPRRAKPSPPLLSHGVACDASTQCMAIKGGHPLHLIRTSTVSASDKPSPLCSPLFSALHRCQATSPHLSPRTQVLELHQSLELLPNPKDWHLHCR